MKMKERLLNLVIDVAVFLMVVMAMLWIFRVEVEDIPKEYDVTYYENIVTLDELARVEE